MTGCGSLSEPRSFSTWRTRLSFLNDAGPRRRPSSHHQDLFEIGQLRQVGLGADAHGAIDRNDDRQHDVGHGRERRVGLRDRDHHRALLARDGDGLQQAPHPADVRDRQDDVAPAHRRRRDQLQVGVEVGAAAHAQAGEARLGVARHEHRHVADAVAIDAARPGDARRGALEIFRNHVTLEVGKRIDRVFQDLVRHRLHVVAALDRAVQARLADRQRVRQSQLELAQAGIAERPAEAGDRRRADAGSPGQRIDVGAQREFRIVEHGRGDLPLRLREGGRAFAHRDQQVADRGAREAERGVRTMQALAALREKVRIAPVTRYASSTVKTTRHLSKVVHGCEMPNPIRPPTCV